MKKKLLLTTLLILIMSLFAQEDIDLFDMNLSTSPSTTTSTQGNVNPGTTMISPDYIIGQNDEIMINVNVWGEIYKPGHYMVPSTTDLLTIISNAGGPKANANIGAIKIVRINAEEDENSIILIDLENFLQTGNYDLIPILKPGDTIVVPGNFMKYFSDFINVVAKVALIINVYYTLTKIN